MNALQILKKLRKYELEQEEHRLMLHHQDVQFRLQSKEEAEVKLQVDLEAKQQFQSTALLQRFDAHFVESEQNIDLKTNEHLLSIQNRDLQIQKTLMSKQRHDMIERVLENRHHSELAELDQKERKFLDDVSQTRYAMGVTS
ncbi:MAG: hypothetical protein V4507_09015 [Verrucomicrobiota bacterium]